MPTLWVHRDFMREFALLEKQTRLRVADAFQKFEDLHAAGGHLEKLAHGRDPRLKTLRIDQFYRGVVLAPESGDTFLLLKVLPHDDAIAWALKHRASENTATHGIELRNDVAIERLTEELEAEPAGTDEELLFAGVSDTDLIRLGVDKKILPLVRRVASVELLEVMRPVLPEQQFDVLYGLAAGMAPEDVWREIVQTQVVAGDEADSVRQGADGSPGDALAAAMARAQGRVALVDGPAELLEILERPLDAWRIFLHPSQRRIAYRTSYAGPARVAGGPGTGKTVVALHRAAHLAARLPDGCPDGAVLLTTFTRDLATELERSLHLLVAEPEQRRRIRVVNIDALANEVLREDRGLERLQILADQHELVARWSRLVRRLDLDFTGVFLDQEWRQIVLAQDLRSAEAYLNASRAGRGNALPPVKRAQVWRAVAAFTEELRSAGQWTFLEVCAEAARVLDRRAAAGEARPFRHVVVDEAQDLHPAQWRLLRAAVAEGTADDLFLTGDSHQRIYGNRVSLRALGIPVSGRSFRLRVNYRSTHEIVTWATTLLGGERVDDMDGGDERLDGYRSTLHGQAPVLAGFPSKSAEIKALVDHVVQLLRDGSVQPHEVGVAVRFIQLGHEIAEGLRRAGVPATMLGAGEQDTSDGIRIGTMHRMKGLEFRCVAVAGVSEGTVPMRNAVTPVETDLHQHRADLLGELSLLFVACTRARETLRVSWHGEPSRFLSLLPLGSV